MTMPQNFTQRRRRKWKTHVLQNNKEHLSHSLTGPASASLKNKALTILSLLARTGLQDPLFHAEQDLSLCSPLLVSNLLVD